MVTDTQTVWGEGITALTISLQNKFEQSVSAVLSSKQIARRWRQHNPEHSSTSSTLEEEDEWRAAILELISASHTLGGVMDLTFEVVGSHFSVRRVDGVDINTHYSTFTQRLRTGLRF